MELQTNTELLVLLLFNIKPWQAHLCRILCLLNIFYRPKGRLAGKSFFSETWVPNFEKLKDADSCPPRFCINSYDEEKEGLLWGNHPNHKSFSVLEPLIRFYSSPGDYILDPFTGSGSTPAACIKLNRFIAGIELRPQWAKVTQSRLMNLKEGQ